ncbi:hypothetical protein ACQI5H_20160 [Mycobacterium heidelbergense]|uniref:hypothetical protein n=1 Tax=Mycobacterium heidelbergense TaxID=53376 RepID=UPI003CE79AAE
MTDTIRHQYGAIYDGLDQIKRALNDAEQLRGDVAKVFASLDDVYTGDAAAALHAAHQQISQQLDQLILDMVSVQGQGVQQQIDTAALDARLAGGF